ncbi:MAG TPA: FAD binding domain-containing protein, partial [Thermoleophilaceae bacterium]|nr:FAD binding domain-containing protein [Thermoleophilaceae bacterium]
MYPGRFEYHAPETLEEALDTLERYGDEGKVLAGGQSLIPLMKLRFASPRALVDITRVPGLDRLAERRVRCASVRSCAIATASARPCSPGASACWA